MLSIIGNSLSGLYAAAGQAARAADRIVSAGAKASDALEASTLAAGNRTYAAVNNFVNGNPAVQGPNPPFLPAFNKPSPDQEIVRGFAELIVAENAYKANIAVFKTADEMLGSLIDNKH